jgi:hypothetical protein
MKPAAWISAALFLTFVRPQGTNPMARIPSDAQLGGLLPAEAGGWTVQPPDRTIEGEGIFDYIDGAGEVYRAYNYRTLIVRRFAKDGGPDISVDVFDMGSSRDAFGVFTHDLEGEVWPVGQGGLYKNGLLQFWRGRYFVSIAADRETPDSKAAVAELGSRIAEAIGADGALPELLDRLPDDFRNAGPVRYLHSPVILNYHFFVSRENVLRLDATTEAVLAVKGEKGSRRCLLLVRYPSPERASEAGRSFFDALRPDLKGRGEAVEGAVRTEAGLWTAAAQEGSYVIAAFQAASEEEARSILETIRPKIRAER